MNTQYRKNLKAVMQKSKEYTDNIYALATNNIAGKDTSTNILAFTEDKGIYVATNNGHWYYWNGTQYVDGGIYQSSTDYNNVKRFCLSKNLVGMDANVLYPVRINYGEWITISTSDGSNMPTDNDLFLILFGENKQRVNWFGLRTGTPSRTIRITNEVYYIGWSRQSSLAYQIELGQTASTYQTYFPNNKALEYFVNDNNNDIFNNLKRITNVYFTEKLYRAYYSNNTAMSINGTSITLTDNIIYKYAVTHGDILFLNLTNDDQTKGLWQFQNSASFPSGDYNQYIIGTTKASDISNIVVVPQGATYLYVSQSVNNTTNAVYKLTSIKSNDLKNKIKWECSVLNSDLTSSYAPYRITNQDILHFDDTDVLITFGDILANGYNCWIRMLDNENNASVVELNRFRTQYIVKKGTYFRVSLGILPFDSSINYVGKINEEDIFKNLQMLKLNENSVVSNLLKDISELDFFTNGYGEDIKTLCEKVEPNMKVNTLTFGCITDTHYERDTNDEMTTHSKIFTSICEKLNVSFMAHLGDMVNQGSLTETGYEYINRHNLWDMMNVYNKSYLPFIYSVGHHEMYPYLGNNEYGFTLDELLAIAGNSTRYIHPTYDETFSNFYFDDIKSKIRIISVNSCSSGTVGFSNDTINFVCNVALETMSSDYKAIILSHNPPIGTLINSSSSVENGDLFISSVNAKINSGHEVLCYIHGHTHFDNVVYEDGVPYPFISICSDYPVPPQDLSADGNPTAYPRPKNTLERYCFDFICINHEGIKLFRFGAGSDRDITF